MSKKVREATTYHILISDCCHGKVTAL